MDVLAHLSAGTLSSAAITAFFQVVFIDLVLAGDNAVVIGLAAAGLPANKRVKAIIIGIIAATLLRIGFASVATRLLDVIGLLLAGGILLLWVCWKMWREIRERAAEIEASAEALANKDLDHSGGVADSVRQKTLFQAAIQIVIADVSMSLDNVLAVAGAAHAHPIVLVFGLGFSVMLMGLAATLIANLLNRWRWIAYVGLAIIFYVAIRMVAEGWIDVTERVFPITRIFS